MRNPLSAIAQCADVGNPLNPFHVLLLTVLEHRILEPGHGPFRGRRGRASSIEPDRAGYDRVRRNDRLLCETHEDNS